MNTADIMVVRLTGAGGHLLPHGGKLRPGPMTDYCTNLICTLPRYEKARMNVLH